MWKCKCGVLNVNYNKQCARHRCGGIRPEDKPDEFDELLQTIREPKSSSSSASNLVEDNINAIVAAGFVVAQRKGLDMTPQEQLFSELFNHEKVLVKDMDLLTLRAHREELAKIAFEARARLTAVDDEEKGRKTKKSDGSPTGFERNLNTDETTTNAINTIKERQKRMSRAEKLQAGLQELFLKAGVSLEDAKRDADKLMSAGTILGKIKEKPSELDTAKFTDPIAEAEAEKEKQEEIQKAAEAKAERLKKLAEEAINEINNLAPKPKSFNPFDKKG